MTIQLEYEIDCLSLKTLIFLFTSIVVATYIPPSVLTIHYRYILITTAPNQINNKDLFSKLTVRGLINNLINYYYLYTSYIGGS